MNEKDNQRAIEEQREIMKNFTWKEMNKSKNLKRLDTESSKKLVDQGKEKERESEIASLLLGSDELRWNEWYAPIKVYLGANVSSVADAAVAYSEISAGLEVSGEAIGPVWAIVIRMIIQMLDGDLDPKMLALIMALLDALAGGS